LNPQTPFQTAVRAVFGDLATAWSSTLTESQREAWSLYAENVLEPGQVITEVVLPSTPTHSATVELREKQSFDWPMVICSVARIDGDWRGCLGAVAPIPWPSEAAMGVLGGRDVTPELAAAAGEAAAADADPLADNEYKVTLVKVATQRALLAASAKEAP